MSLFYHDPASEPCVKITPEEVGRIAALARIDLAIAGEEELERMRGQLDHILAYIAKLNELDTERVDPATGIAAGGTGALRLDVTLATLSEEEALANAPESGRGHFKVPRVIA